MLGEDLEVKGTTDAEFTVAVRNSKIDSIKASGGRRFSQDEPSYDRCWRLEIWFRWSVLQMDAMLGSLEDYFQLNGGNYNISTKKLNGELIAYNVPIREIVLAGETKLEKYPGVHQRLSVLTGKMGLSAILGGTSDNPVISLNEFESSQPDAW